MPNFYCAPCLVCARLISPRQLAHHINHNMHDHIEASALGCARMPPAFLEGARLTGWRSSRGSSVHGINLRRVLLGGDRGPKRSTHYSRLF